MTHPSHPDVKGTAGDLAQNTCNGKATAKKGRGFGASLGPMGLPLATLSSFLTMQDVEDHKPRLSKMSWLPVILVYRASIIPTILGSVSVVTLFSAAVALVSVWWGKEVGLTNNVVPLLSVVVGLLLVFRNSSAYERYSEGRKDFRSLISNARNLSRLVWIFVSPTPPGHREPPMTRTQLTLEKKRLIRLIVAFVVATKHHLRAEGGVHHDDLKGLLPPKLGGVTLGHLRTSSAPDASLDDLLDISPRQQLSAPLSSSPGLDGADEESSLGLLGRSRREQNTSTSLHSPSRASLRSWRSENLRSSTVTQARQRIVPKRRPTAVRIVSPELFGQTPHTASNSIERNHAKLRKRADERTPLIKAGVKPDVRKSVDDIETSMDNVRRAEVGLGRMVELGLPLIITIFRFRRMGFIEATGPAGHNTMQALVNSMTDQLGSMERIVQTPMAYIIAVHMKQATTMLLFVLPFTRVDALGAKMVPLMALIAIIYMEGIAAQVEQPFGTDPCDLNLDLFCTELLCECEALLERLPEGDRDDRFILEREMAQDDVDGDGDDGGDE